MSGGSPAPVAWPLPTSPDFTLPLLPLYPRHAELLWVSPKRHSLPSQSAFVHVVLSVSDPSLTHFWFYVNSMGNLSPPLPLDRCTLWAPMRTACLLLCSYMVLVDLSNPFTRHSLAIERRLIRFCISHHKACTE